LTRKANKDLTHTAIQKEVSPSTADRPSKLDDDGISISNEDDDAISDDGEEQVTSELAGNCCPCHLISINVNDNGY